MKPFAEKPQRVLRHWYVCVWVAQDMCIDLPGRNTPAEALRQALAYIAQITGEPVPASSPSPARQEVSQASFLF